MVSTRSLFSILIFFGSIIAVIGGSIAYFSIERNYIESKTPIKPTFKYKWNDKLQKLDTIYIYKLYNK